MSLRELNKACFQWKMMQKKVNKYNRHVLRACKYVLPLHFKRFIDSLSGTYTEDKTSGNVIKENIGYHFYLKDGKITLDSTVSYFICGDTVGKNICMV